MIAKLRRKFILLAMLSLAAVLIVIMGAVNLANYHDLNRNADEVLSILSSNGGLFPKPDRPFGRPGQGEAFTAETPYETRFFTVELGADGSVVSVNTGSIAAVNSSDAVEYAQDIWNSRRASGYVGNYKFLKSESADKTLIVFLDRGRELMAFRTFLTASAVVSVSGILAVFLLLLFLSGRAVRPVAESYEKQKRFITDAGHELKTPLTIIDTNTEVLELEQGESEWSRSIRNQVRRLASLTESLVSLSRMDESASNLVMVEFSLSDAVEESAEPFLALSEARGRKLSLQIETNISYRGNEASIRQLVSILLDNAVKYASPDSEIELSLKRQGKTTALVCKNAVPSIEKGAHDILFERFYRADASRNSETGGYGIGLSMARAIVTAHKGRITARSEDGASLTITALL